MVKYFNGEKHLPFAIEEGMDRELATIDNVDDMCEKVWGRQLE
jgi:hypothetical protein